MIHKLRATPTGGLAADVEFQADAGAADDVGGKPPAIPHVATADAAVPAALVLAVEVLETGAVLEAADDTENTSVQQIKAVLSVLPSASAPDWPYRLRHFSGCLLGRSTRASRLARECQGKSTPQKQLVQKGNRDRAAL
jgi:hypothetical protein